MRYSNMANINVSGLTDFSVSFWKYLSCCILVIHMSIDHSMGKVRQPHMIFRSVYFLHDVAQQATSLYEMIGLIWFSVWSSYRPDEARSHRWMPYAQAAVVCTGYVLGSAASVDPTLILSCCCDRCICLSAHNSSSSALDGWTSSSCSCLMTSSLASQRLRYSNPDVS